ncbi:unnamed protein product [Phaedon cochleariae]|uniref:Sema domain-containing protein n=1 Tax=Phaedon cochleariae TaxID=80249 RepID=A0A9N9SBU8_PHACE|nr:unnamed protein product [Phaedon cochleariae]
MFFLDPNACPCIRFYNVNKALVIDYTTTRLISCGSLSQGICSVRNLHNISDGTLEVMYVGVTFTLGSPYRSEVPAVSSRSLDKEKMFAIAQTAVTTGTRMFVNSLARERYPITYVYGFASEGFSYFLTTQMKHTSSGVYISKLVRVCHDDENYYSYTEIPMDCIGESGRRYNLVQAAYVGKAGSDLASDLGITAQDDVLFAVFGESDAAAANRPSDLAALCVYSLKAIRRKFMQNIRHCFNGKGQRGLDFISPSHQCVPTEIDIREKTSIQERRKIVVVGQGGQRSRLRFDYHRAGRYPVRPSDLAALFSLKAIRSKFMQNIRHCFNGKGQRGLDFISPSHQCVPMVPVDDIRPHLESSRLCTEGEYLLIRPI